MFVYFANIALIIFWGIVLLKYKPSEKKKKIYCGIVALQWILISGLRHVSIGADTENYREAFYRAQDTSWGTIITNCIDYIFYDANVKDPGYYLLQKMFQIFSDSYQVFLIFIAVTFTGLMARWIYKNSEAPDISFIIYSVLFYAFFAITGHRQTLATALIVFLGFDFIRDRKPIKFAIVAFIAFMLHKSAFVYIPYYFLASIPISLPYIVLAAIVILVFFLFGQQLYTPLVGFIGYEEDLVENTVGGGELYAVMITVICVGIMMFYPMIKCHREDIKLWMNLLLLSILTSFLVLQVQGFMRIQQYFTPSLMVLVPEVIMCVNKKYRNIVHYAAIAIMTMYLIYNHPTYMFFWQ